jgi:hypothetical protein
MKIVGSLCFPTLALSFLAALASVPLARAAENPVHWAVSGVPRKPIAPGASSMAKLIAAIDPGWHLYALEQEEGGPIPLEIAAAGDNSLLTLGVVQASKPVQLMDRNFNKRVSLYVQTAEFRLPLTLSSTAPPGSQPGAFQVRYQCCNETVCLPPRTTAIDLPISVKSIK